MVGELKKANENILEFLAGDNIFCSNAYIMARSRDGNSLCRAREIPASIYEIKDGGGEFRDRLFESDALREQDRELQLNQSKHAYVICEANGKPYLRINPAVEERYHHRRPEDKSIGRALDSADGENANFYQISSIMRGQDFGGYITHTSQTEKG